MIIQIADVFKQATEAIEAVEAHADLHGELRWRRALSIYAKEPPWVALNISRSTFHRWKRLDWRERARRVNKRVELRVRTSLPEYARAQA